jgi:predicted nucleic acid-binding protein
VFFDSCVLIDALNGHPGAISYLSRNETHHISVVTRAEVIAGCSNDTDVSTALQLCDDLKNHSLDQAMADQAGQLRRQYRLKTPDAIIVAAALASRQTLVTRDQRLVKIADLKIETYTI